MAMLPDGANSNEALKLAEYKTKLNKIKAATMEPLKAGLVEYKLDTSGRAPTLKARLMLASAIEYGRGVLPSKMLQAKNMKDVRLAVASESRAFLQRGDLAKLPEALRDPAKKIFDWWITAVDQEIAADAATNATATTTTTSEGLGGSIFS